MEVIFQIAGWLGAVVIVLAYVLESNKKIDGTGRAYQLMNLVGAVGVGVNAFHQQAWPPFAIQVAWGIVAISSLAKSGRHGK